ncbi:hypothetical protein IWX65_002059 [Arthrobacter sp. CAN_A214]|uniref:hypothetical protein n=1 Tax=Arthrobacter sp. CAN_A214 TaxID=2787720 RepID=UPI0018CBB155
MNKDDLHRIQVAAADKEAAAFEFDHAALNLEEAVAAALRHGEDAMLIAEAADLPGSEVLQLKGGLESEPEV